MSEQAESALESDSLGSLAEYLSDTPEEESTEQVEGETTEESTAEGDTDESDNDEQEDEDSEGDEPDEEKEPTPVAKVTIKVKGDDGELETLELSTDEIAASYMRQRDYSKKTQALAERETQAVEFLKSKHDEIRQQYVSQAESARLAVSQLAGLKTEAELAELAGTDPAAWVAETQRQRQIGAYLQGLDRQIAQERQSAQAEAQQRQQQALQSQYQQAWKALEAEKIDKPKLAKIYSDVTKMYGYTEQELSNVYDHRLVKILRDATAYQALKAQKPAVQKQVADAPRMPTRQSKPQEPVNRERENRFKTGRAKLNDLASLFM